MRYAFSSTTVYASFLSSFVSHFFLYYSVGVDSLGMYYGFYQLSVISVVSLLITEVLLVLFFVYIEWLCHISVHRFHHIKVIMSAGTILSLAAASPVICCYKKYNKQTNVRKKFAFEYE